MTLLKTLKSILEAHNRTFDDIAYVTNVYRQGYQKHISFKSFAEAVEGIEDNNISIHIRIVLKNGDYVYRFLEKRYNGIDEGWCFEYHEDLNQPVIDLEEEDFDDLILHN